MSFFKNVLNKISPFSKSKWVRWFWIIASLLLLLLIIRTCTGGAILKNTTYHIARSSNWNPIQLSGKEDNLIAFINELITSIAQSEHLKVDIVTYRTGDLLAMLKNDEYDAVIMTITIDPFLKERYAVSDSIFYAGPVLVVPTTSSVKSLEELKGKPIGISKDSPLSFRLMSSHPDMLLISYDDNLTALNDLESQSLAGVILEAQLAYTYTQSLYKGKLKVVTAPLFDLGIRLITRKEPRGEAFIEYFNKELERLKKNGDYSRLLHKWELTTPNERR